MSDLRNAAADIPLRSIWENVAGEQVRVMNTAAGYVRFEPLGAEPVTVHCLDFRATFRPFYDRHGFASQFSMSLANLSEFHAFFSPTARRFYARSACRHVDSAFASSRGSPAIPKDSIHVGTYAHPCPTINFLNDLDELLEKLRRSGA